MSLSFIADQRRIALYKKIMTVWLTRVYTG